MMIYNLENGFFYKKTYRKLIGVIRIKTQLNLEKLFDQYRFKGYGCESDITIFAVGRFP